MSKDDFPYGPIIRAGQTAGFPDPDHTGQDANHRGETEWASAIAVWLHEKDGSVWVSEDGEIGMRSAWGKYVTEWHGIAILAAQRWSETKMPISRGETITGERASFAPHGTVLARCDGNGRVVPGKRVISTDGPTARTDRSTRSSPSYSPSSGWSCRSCSATAGAEWRSW